MPAIDYSRLRVIPGRPYPAGVSVYEEGARFTVFSRHATRVWLALFEHTADAEPAWEYEYDAERHRVGDIWSIFVYGVHEGALYKYRMDGPYDPEAGHRFNRESLLLDPVGKAFVGAPQDGTMKSVVVHDEMDWAEDRRLKTPMSETVIYETHVRGFTRHASSGSAHPGTYRGLVEKIPYLKKLGVTAVELLPVQEFGEQSLGRCSLATGKELVNYWGYSNIGFYAPAGRYACSAERLEHLEEFREMVRALHEAGIEVILDVVFNHTAEGDDRGPTLCFKGIDNSIYYILNEDGGYYNYSGCGNTVNCNHPHVRDFILECLRHWVAVMHIDGFRFDLASILGRDEQGNVLENPPLIRRIAEDPVLRDCKIIAEAWDAGGAYQVGSFGSGARWAEWNGKYRDDVRRYWRGDVDMRPSLASRIMGSADLYHGSGRSPAHSINFVTCHDGFTLRDLVSYKHKHNLANGENNRDGSNHDFSHNYGAEGETEDPKINAVRRCMQKNFIATLFLSLGTPMLLGGDELGRTQRGNNNAYCQDNAISWYDWGLLEAYADLHRFTTEAIQFRRENPALMRTGYFEPGAMTETGTPEVEWLDEGGGPIDWDAPEGQLACRIDASVNGGTDLLLIFNPGTREFDWELPAGKWAVRIDTAAQSPHDIVCVSDANPVETGTIPVAPRALMALTCEI